MGLPCAWLILVMLYRILIIFWPLICWVVSMHLETKHWSDLLKFGGPIHYGPPSDWLTSGHTLLNPSSDSPWCLVVIEVGFYKDRLSISWHISAWSLFGSWVYFMFQWYHWNILYQNDVFMQLSALYSHVNINFCFISWHLMTDFFSWSSRVIIGAVTENQQSSWCLVPPVTTKLPSWQL